MEFTGGSMELRAVRLAGGDEDIKDACEFVGEGGHCRGTAELGPHAAVVFAKFVFGVELRLCGHALRAGDPVGGGLGAGAEDFATADAVIGTNTEPGGDVLCGGKRGEVAAEFANSIRSIVWGFSRCLRLPRFDGHGVEQKKVCFPR